ncbi:hypothetical protein HRbin06_00840 [archaeon HR06]|nr:hypothetical protein HRbin06_00840 [archaeon HR06]
MLLVEKELEREDKLICEMKFGLLVQRETIIPPFSSKVSRSIILINLNKLDLKNLKLAFSLKNKPLRITPLMVKNKPLLKIKKDKFSFLTLLPNKNYEFSISVIGSDLVQDLMILSKELKEEIEIYNSKIHVYPKEIKICSLKNLGLKDSKYFYIRIVTPALLQLPKPWKLKKARHFLFPIPSLILYSLVKHWNTFADSNLYIKNIHGFVWRSNYLLTEVDYNLKPVTVIYDEEKEIRGFIVSIIYELRARKNTLFYKYVKVLFDYANYFGIGRSRSIGFGLCEINSYE